MCQCFLSWLNDRCLKTSEHSWLGQFHLQCLPFAVAWDSPMVGTSWWIKTSKPPRVCLRLVSVIDLANVQHNPWGWNACKKIAQSSLPFPRSQDSQSIKGPSCWKVGLLPCVPSIYMQVVVHPMQIYFSFIVNSIWVNSYHVPLGSMSPS